MKKIFEARELPDDAKLYFRKDFLGWKQIHPIKDPETDKINWGNVFYGGKRNLFFLCGMLILLLLFYAGTKELISAYEEVADNPCAFCTTCHEQTRQVLDGLRVGKMPSVNTSSFNITALIPTEEQGGDIN